MSPATEGQTQGTAAGEPSAAPGPVERRYRQVLAALPAAYRRDWEEEMVATLLAGSGGRGRLPWAEAASVLALAVRLRLGGSGDRRSQALGEALRFVGLSALLLQVVVALLAAVGLVRRMGVLPVNPEQPQTFPAGWSAAVFLGLELLPLFWLAGYLGSVLGRRQLARVGVLSAVVIELWLAGRGLTWMLLRGDMEQMTRYPMLAFEIVLLPAAVSVLALIGFHRDAPPVRARPWLVALPAGLLIGPSATAWLAPNRLDGTVQDDISLLSLLVLAAGLWCLVRLALGRPSGAAWTLALTVVTAATLVLRLIRLAGYVQEYQEYQDYQGFRYAYGVRPAAVEAALLAVLGITLALAARRALADPPLVASDGVPARR